MEIVVNGERHQAAAACTLLELLDSLAIDPARVAVELNGAIIKKDRWADTLLAPGARIEIVHFVGGG